MADTSIKDGVDAAPAQAADKVPISRSGSKNILSIDDLTSFTLSQQQSTITTSTGWLSGGEVTLNATPGQFDYASGFGVFTDATDPSDITTSIVTWTGATGVAPTNIATEAITFLCIDDLGALFQSNTFPVEDSLRDCIQIGAVTHADNVNITSTSDFVSAVPYQLAPSLTDLIIALGVINVSGNDIGGSGNANLKFSKSAGVMFYFGIEAKIDPNDPNNISTPLLSEPGIIFSWRDGSGGFSTAFSDAVTAGVFDDDTGGASSPSGTVTTNNWVNMRVKYSPDANILVMEYGRTTYNNSSNAVAAMSMDSYTDDPGFAGVPVIGYYALRGAASDTDSSGDAVFIQTNKFGLL